MDDNNKYFIALLTAFIKEEVPPKPVNIDWNKIYKLAAIHSVSGAVYLAALRLEEKDKREVSILNKLKSDFFHTTYRYEEQEVIYQEIKKRLNDAHIKHLFIKGIIVRDYYPVKQMRTLGDIDIVIDNKDMQAVKEALIEIGYKNIVSINEYHWQYVKRKSLIEVHDKLFYNNINLKSDFVTYFQNAWDNSISEENNYTYKLNMEYQLIFLIAHISKHFSSSGVGVRMILDIAVIINKFGNSINYSYILEELKKIKLDVFAENIFNLCDKWFKVKIPDITFNIDNNILDVISDYILECGSFGCTGKKQVFYEILKKYKKVDNHKLKMIKSFISKIFLKYNYMKELYPALVKFPILLPLTWILRWYNCLTKKRSRTLNILKSFTKGSDEINDMYIMMQKIGVLDFNETNSNS